MPGRTHGISRWVPALILATCSRAADAATLHPGDLVIAHKEPTDQVTGVLSVLDPVSGDLITVASGGLLSGVNGSEIYRNLGDLEVTRDGQVFVSNLDNNTIVRVTTSTGAVSLTADLSGAGGWGGLALAP